ncbi:hypothetical protein M9434_006879 [Picochlorum sp. BPE23]|nr:hypothetical protein M9434_006879 [Picochlorum sp. BPE23]
MSGTHLDVFSTTLVFPIMSLSAETRTAAAANQGGGQEGEQQQPRRDCHGVAVIFNTVVYYSRERIVVPRLLSVFIGV